MTKLVYKRSSHQSRVKCQAASDAKSHSPYQQHPQATRGFAFFDFCHFGKLAISYPLFASYGIASFTSVTQSRPISWPSQVPVQMIVSQSRKFSAVRWI